MESKYSDDWDEATDIEQHTNEINLDADGGVRNFETKMNNRYETKKADVEEEKKNGSKGLHNDDQSDTSEIYQNEEFEQPTPIPETRAPLPYARDSKTHKTSASQERHNFPAGAPATKTRMEICKPHLTLDSYNHQIIVQQQLQLQMMQNEIDRLRALIEENGFGVKDSKLEHKIKSQSTNLGLGNAPSMYEEEHSDVLSMRSVKSSNAVFHSKTVNLSMTSSVRLLPIMRERRDMTTRYE